VPGGLAGPWQACPAPPPSFTQRSGVRPDETPLAVMSLQRQELQERLLTSSERAKDSEMFTRCSERALRPPTLLKAARTAL
jgi:hypothetical protein